MSGAGSDNPSPQPGFAAGNFNSVQQMAQSQMAPGMNVTSSLPVGDMSVTAGDGSVMTNPVVTRNFMVANARSRLTGRADQIRGDLPIAPCKSGWFNPSVNPGVDLKAGALNAIAGNSNEMSNAFAALVASSNGGIITPLGGVANPFAGVAPTSLPSYAQNMVQNDSMVTLSAMPL